MDNINFGVSEEAQTTMDISDTVFDIVEQISEEVQNIIDVGAAVPVEESIDNEDTDDSMPSLIGSTDDEFTLTSEEEQLLMEATTEEAEDSDELRSPPVELSISIPQPVPYPPVDDILTPRTEPAAGDIEDDVEDVVVDGRLNELAQEEQKEESEEDIEEDDPTCGICYVELNVKNIVNTKCNHHFCKACFFRWIEVNATCPNCRDPINSNTTLTNDQFAREQTLAYEEYITVVKDWSRTLKRNNRLIRENNKLQIENYRVKSESDAFFRRIDRLKTDLARHEGYNHGCISAKNQIIYGHPMHHKYFERGGSQIYSSGGWLDGYESGFNQFLREYKKREEECSLRDKEEFAEVSQQVYSTKIAETKQNYSNVLTNRKIVKPVKRNIFENRKKYSRNRK